MALQVIFPEMGGSIQPIAASGATDTTSDISFENAVNCFRNRMSHYMNDITKAT